MSGCEASRSRRRHSASHTTGRPNGSASLIRSKPRRIPGSSFSKYCPRTGPSVERCGSPTPRFGERLDFSLSFCPRHSTAWPAAFQITLKNNAESSLLELLRDVFSKNFQTSMPFVWFLMFISFHECGITGCIKFPLWWWFVRLTTRHGQKG